MTGRRRRPRILDAMAVRLLALAAFPALALALAACGGEPGYALDPTADCLEERGAALERWDPGPDAPRLGARAAPGGVLQARFDQQVAWAAFADDAGEAEELAGELEASQAPPGSVAAILRPVVESERNAVVWGYFPEGDELTEGFRDALAAVEDCLREGEG